MENITQLLARFETVTLKEMENVKLMDRIDTKYILTMKEFERIIREMQDQYRVMVVGDNSICRYQTLYYDTPRMDLYTQHHNRKLNRYKIRHRTYVESDLGFLEVKFKNNKGRTIKKRISKQETPLCWDEDSELFLKKHLPFSPGTLSPVMWVNYNRSTLVNKTTAERLTFDLQLEFVKDGLSKKLENLVIAELKQDKQKASPFKAMMKKYHIREGSISKYCMGIAYTMSGIKKNNFKNTLRSITFKNQC